MEKKDGNNEFKIGEYVIDTYNGFNDPKFSFIEGEKYDPSLALCKIIDIKETSICVLVNKFPKRIYVHDGGRISKGISCEQWFKIKREHEEEIGFHFRFKKQK